MSSKICRYLLLSITISLAFSPVRVYSQVGDANEQGIYPPHEVEIKLRVFIPAQIVKVSIDPCNSGYGFGGDNRGYSYDKPTSRIEYTVVVTTDPQRPVRITPKREFAGAVITTKYDDKFLEPTPQRPSWWWQYRKGYQYQPPVASKAQTVPEEIEVIDNKDFGTYYIYTRLPKITMTIGRVGNPFCAGIYANPDATFEISLQQVGSRLFYQIQFVHDNFPAYELYINKQQVYGWMPDNDKDIWGIFRGSSNPILDTITASYLSQVSGNSAWELLGGSRSLTGDNFNLRLFMEGNLFAFPTPSYPSYLSSQFYVKKGQILYLGAVGKMVYGSRIGKGNANGVFSNLNDEIISQCTPWKQFRHGALVYKISGSDSTYLAGTETSMIVPNDGELIFSINDSCDEDDFGEFLISGVTITPPK